MKKIVSFILALLLFLTMFIIISQTLSANAIGEIKDGAKITSFNCQKLQKVFFSPTIRVQVTYAQKTKVEQQLRNYEAEIVMLSKLLYREARGINSKTEQAAVAWCVLNRVDSNQFPNTIRGVITQRNQFAWVSNTPVWQSLYDLSKDVVTRWLLEKYRTIPDVGRVLPKDYLFFAGKRGRNYFRKGYRTSSYWNWSLNSPY